MHSTSLSNITLYFPNNGKKYGPITSSTHFQPHLHHISSQSHLTNQSIAKTTAPATPTTMLRPDDILTPAPWKATGFEPPLPPLVEEPPLPDPEPDPVGEAAPPETVADAVDVALVLTKTPPPMKGELVLLPPAAAAALYAARVFGDGGALYRSISQVCQCQYWWEVDTYGSLTTMFMPF